MKGRLALPSSLLGAVLVMGASVGGSACSSSTSSTDLDPAGPPRILQVFVNARNGNGLPFRDPFVLAPYHDPFIIDGGDLAWGVQRDVGICTFDDKCPTADSPDLPAGHFPAGYTCDTNRGICLGSDGEQHGPGGASLVQDGIIWNTDGGLPIIQIVFKELLDGATAEQFACACSKIIRISPTTGAVSLAAGNCGGGKSFTTDGLHCADCPDNPDTPDSEAGACFDINTDGIPDLPALIPGIVSISCAGTTYTYSNGGTSCATVSAAGVPAPVTAGACSGFYDPSGNQIIPIDTGYAGLGPRLFLYPSLAGPMPADNDCELTVSNMIKDKDGLALVTPTEPIRWHTEVVQIIATDPEGGPPGMAPPVPVPDAISVSMNTLLNPSTVHADTITVQSEPQPQTVPPTAPTAVAGTTELDAMDHTLLVWTPTAPLAVGLKYTVTVKGGAASIKDTFGKAKPGDDVFAFIGAAAALMSSPRKR